MRDERQETPERWQQVKNILAAALEREPAKRAAYLEQVCTEPSLRREVESLIAAHEQADSSFMNQSTVRNGSLKSGVKLGPYEILAPLGAGGMGEVYRARDSRLDREVALKVLPTGLLADEAARRRFRKEALALAKLSHSHIAVIHDVGEEAGVDYLVMECVPGQSMAEKLKSGALPEKEVASLGAQIAEALEEAHERGVIHRDLKTGNIMITPKGQVKVLDFGLAKLLRPVSDTMATESFTETQGIAGTLPYMAPEQLTGEPVDARTDIYALGAVLFEMAVGRRPFQEDSAPRLTDAILHQQPVSPRALNPHVSPELERITLKCLEKSVENRYQSAKELQVDLRRLGAPATVAAPTKARSWWRNKAALAIAAVVAAAVIVVMAAMYLFRSKSNPPLAGQREWIQLTNFADSAVSPALSPDGRMLTFIRGSHTFYGPGQVYLKLLPDGEPVQLTHDNLMKMSPKFSPDGSRIAYTGLGVWDTWVVPALGGEARVMLPNASGLTWIDNQHVLFSELKTGMHMGLVTASESRTESRDLYLPPRDRGMAHRSSLSPDHKWVLLAEMDNGGWRPCRLVPFNGSSAGNSVGPLGAGCTNAAWSPDETHMYFSSDAGGRFHIWRQRFPDGQPEQLTSGPTEEEGIAIAPDGQSLITSVGLAARTVWVHDAKGDRQISSEDYAEFPRFSPDGGKLYYLVRRRGASTEFEKGELWVTDLETNRSERVLPGFAVTGYDISADGKRVAFSAEDDQGRSHVWLASVNLRSPPKQFPSSVGQDEPFFDLNGHLYFRAAEGGSNFLYRMKEDGTGLEKAIPDPIYELYGISPDGQWAIISVAVKGDAPYATSAYPIGGGSPVAICSGYCPGGWAPGGQFFYAYLEFMGEGQTLLLPIAQGKSLPAIPRAGIQTKADAESISGARVLDGDITPGPTPRLYASSRRSVHRNLYRIPLQ